MKVAQHGVLGNDVKKTHPSWRDERNTQLLASHATQRLPSIGRSFHAGRIALLTTLTQSAAADAGLPSSGPFGTDSLQPPATRAFVIAAYPVVAERERETVGRLPKNAQPGFYIL
jgi:hypothetical protein